VAPDVAVCEGRVPVLRDEDVGGRVDDGEVGPGGHAELPHAQVPLEVKRDLVQRAVRDGGGPVRAVRQKRTPLPKRFLIQRRGLRVPVVEVAHKRRAQRSRRPVAEPQSMHSVLLPTPKTHHLIPPRERLQSPARRPSIPLRLLNRLHRTPIQRRTML
jgi:hypothetical protein